MDFNEIEKIVDKRLKKAVKADSNEEIERWIKLHCKIAIILSKYRLLAQEAPQINFIEGVDDSKI